MKKSEAEQETGSLLSEMMKLQEQLGRLIQRLQDVQLDPRSLKKCARAVGKAMESIVMFTTIIGKEETKDPELIYTLNEASRNSDNHQHAYESVAEKCESETALKTERDSQNPRASKTKRRHVKEEEEGSISEKRKTDDNSMDGITMEKIADEDAKELSENEENNTSAESEDQTSPKERHECSECKKSFTSKYYLKYHEKTHSEDTKTRCDLCSKVYSSYELMLKHRERIHSKKRRLECEHCSKQFSGASQLKIHLRDHTGEKPYQCPHCEAKFKKKSCMKDHVNIHTGARPYLCNICGKGFAGRGGLYLHTKIHTKDYPHHCETCHKRFPTKQRLNDHLKSHSEERPYRCYVKDCNTVFKSEVTLKKHIKGTHGPKQYFCDICAKQFTRAASLKLHTQLHQGAYKYTCQQCNKTFRDSSRLRQHEQVHNNIRPFVCTECKKGFHNKRTLQDHFRIHTGEKPFTCHICERKFTQSSTLNKHIRSHQKGLREVTADKIQKQKASKSTEERNIEKVTNNTSLLGQNMLYNTALSGLPITETQQSRQPATAQLQSSTAKEAMQQQLFSTTNQIVPTEQMSQQQAATTQTTMEQQKQMNITGPKIIPTSQVRFHTESQVKLEDEKELLTRNEQNLSLPQRATDGQDEQSHGSSNTIDPTTSALAILANSGVQHHHSFSRLLRSSNHSSSATITTSTTSPMISTTNVPSGASVTKQVQPSALFTSGLASFSETPESRYSVPPIANIMSSLKSSGGGGEPYQTNATSTSLSLAATCAGTATSSHHMSSENTVTLASTKSIPPQVLGIQQIAAQIIQEAKKQEGKVTE